MDSIKKFRSLQKKWNKRLAYVIKAKGGNGYNQYNNNCVVLYFFLYLKKNNKNKL